MENEKCFNFAMRKSGRLINQFYEERLSKVNLKSGQFSILRAVNFRKETTNKQLQKILILDQSTLSRNLKPLIRDGFLNVTPDPNDQRSKIISLTTEGKSLYEKALPLWHDAQKALIKKMGKDETAKILSLSETFQEEFISD